MVLDGGGRKLLGRYHKCFPLVVTECKKKRKTDTCSTVRVNLQPWAPVDPCSSRVRRGGAALGKAGCPAVSVYLPEG